MASKLVNMASLPGVLTRNKKERLSKNRFGEVIRTHQYWEKVWARTIQATLWMFRVVLCGVTVVGRKCEK